MKGKLEWEPHVLKAWLTALTSALPHFNCSRLSTERMQLFMCLRGLFGRRRTGIGLAGRTWGQWLATRGPS